jgi:uncharacterized protein YjcR
MSISMKEHERARALYVIGGLTYEQVAAETGISKSTLVRWGKEENWREQKTFFNTASSETNHELLQIRQSLSQLLRKAISREDGKLDKQGAGVSPKVLSAVARLAEVTALYFQPPAE